MGAVTDELERRIRAALAPERLEVIDQSRRHRRHHGYNEAGESHFKVVVEAAAFEGMNRIERVRAVQQAAGDLVTSGRIHAFTVDARVPAAPQPG